MGACDWSPTEKCKKQGKGTGEENRKISGTDFKTKLKNLGVDKDIQERWRIKLGFKAGRGSNDYPRDIECCVNSKKNDVTKTIKKKIKSTTKETPEDETQKKKTTKRATITNKRVQERNP